MKNWKANAKYGIQLQIKHSLGPPLFALWCSCLHLLGERLLSSNFPLIYELSFLLFFTTVHLPPACCFLHPSKWVETNRFVWLAETHRIGFANRSWSVDFPTTCRLIRLASGSTLDLSPWNWKHWNKHIKNCIEFEHWKCIATDTHTLTSAGKLISIC